MTITDRTETPGSPQFRLRREIERYSANPTTDHAAHLMRYACWSSERIGGRIASGWSMDHPFSISAKGLWFAMSKIWDEFFNSLDEATEREHAELFCFAFDTTQIAPVTRADIEATKSWDRDPAPALRGWHDENTECSHPTPAGDARRALVRRDIALSIRPTACEFSGGALTCVGVGAA